jgi:RNA polymerase sigma factor (sigma-70 family)
MAARQGDREAFAALVRSASDRLYAIAYRILRDPDRAADALQRALIAIWDDLPGLRDPDRFEAWATRLLVRTCYREAANERRQARVRALRAVGPGTELDLAGRIAERDQLEQGFRRLSPAHRSILVLRFYLDATVPEIARVLGIPEGTAESRLHYALRSLRAELEAGTRTMAVEEAVS